MNHIVKLRLKIEKKIHPNLLVRLLPFLKTVKVYLGFTFNYRAFLNAYGSFDSSLNDIEGLSLDERNNIIIYGAAIEYCINNNKRVFFSKEDILKATNMLSVEDYKKILEAMSYAKMPEWLQSVMDNLPSREEKGIKKK